MVPKYTFEAAKPSQQKITFLVKEVFEDDDDDKELVKGSKLKKFLPWHVSEQCDQIWRYFKSLWYFFEGLFRQNIGQIFIVVNGQTAIHLVPLFPR